jgi:hypothetical protein
MKATTAKEVLIATKWILTHYDWCQLHWEIDVDGDCTSNPTEYTSGKRRLKSCCLSGAIGLVEADWATKYDALGAIDKAIGGTYVSTWNDQAGRTKEQVLALLDTLIEKV